MTEQSRAMDDLGPMLVDTFEGLAEGSVDIAEIHQLSGGPRVILAELLRVSVVADFEGVASFSPSPEPSVSAAQEVVIPFDLESPIRIVFARFLDGLLDISERGLLVAAASRDRGHGTEVAV